MFAYVVCTAAAIGDVWLFCRGIEINPRGFNQIQFIGTNTHMHIHTHAMA